MLRRSGQRQPGRMEAIVRPASPPAAAPTSPCSCDSSRFGATTIRASSRRRSRAFSLSADDPVPFVVERLASDNRDIARAAAIALGEARPDVRHAVMLALATSRDDAAFDTLLALVARGAAADSKAAVEALRLYAHDEALQHRVGAALDARRSGRRR